MQTIEEYLNGEFKEGKLRLRQIYDCLVKIARLFDRSYLSECCGWDYEFPEDSPDKTPGSEDYSYSTQAMCAFALTRLTTAAFWHETCSEEQSLRKAILQKKNDCVQHLCARLNENAELKRKGKTEQLLWESGTYGEEDPLTAAWIIELVSQERCSLDPMVAKRLQEAVREALGSNFNAILRNNRAGAHAFPVYRCVSAIRKILDDTDSWQTTKEQCQNLLSEAGYWFEQELHRQLSHYHFNDFRFDAPELIYSLAGALQTGRLRPQDPLIREVLEVIRTVQQERSVYWRPYRPFLVKPQGLVLMPLSVEVADALLGTLKVTGHFDQLRDSLSGYYEWLMGQGKPEDSDMIGWRSENAFGPPEVEKIHTWTTSRVAMFLLNYSRLLDHALQSGLLSHSGLSIKEPDDLLAWEDIQPMDLGRKKVDKRIMPMVEKHFIRSHESTLKKEIGLNPDGGFSMFLYGPPGTSKTSLAEGLAKELDLKLVTITVSDFILLGVEAVEQRAKVIFETLSELKNVVVLFDEIDRLITDRDSDRYLRQGDILQLMTPSMLTKLNDLRRKKKLLFVISTNYFERIDRAIRRPGRIDQHFLIPPFDQESRVALLNNFICKCKELGKKGKDWELLSNHETPLNNIAKRAPLLIFEELKRVFERSMSGLGKGDVNALLRNLESEIQQVKPSITIRSYKSKFDAKRLDPDEQPYREFFFLCFLLAEVDQANEEVKEFFQKQWDEWNKENAPEVDELTSDEWVQEQLEKLGVLPTKAKAKVETTEGGAKDEA